MSMSLFALAFGRMKTRSVLEVRQALQVFVADYSPDEDRGQLAFSNSCSREAFQILMGCGHTLVVWSYAIPKPDKGAELACPACGPR